MQTRSIKNARILVIDDDRGITSIAKRFLEEVGSCVVREENFSEKGYASACEFRPDLILLDWNMPIMDGGEVAVLLAKDPALRQIPIIFITGYGDRARKLGFPVLEKPFSWTKLLDCIATALNANAIAA